MSTRRDSFKNLTEFGSIIEGLDVYESRPIHTFLGDRQVGSERIYGMVNTTQQRITMPVSKDYPVFDHRKSLGYVLKELTARAVNVHGFIDTVGDRTYSRVLFDGVEVHDADSKVELGMSFENPMDRKTRFKGYGYTFRQICTNGAGIKTMLPIMEINERHTKDMEIRVPPMIHDFVSQILGQTNHMQNLINNASKEIIRFESNEQLLVTLKNMFDSISERHVKRIANYIETTIGLEPSRWDLFNACNWVTSHTPVSPDVRSEIDRIAENFINPQVTITPTKLVNQGE